MPAYNAGATIEQVFARIPADARTRIRRYVVVNDGSIDDTAAALARLQNEVSNLVVLTHSTNRGYREAEKTLLGLALQDGADAGIVLHSDGQYSPEKIIELLDPFDRDSADLVQGCWAVGRWGPARRYAAYKFIANKALTAIENWAFGMNLAEYHSGYMLYSRKTLETIPSKSHRSWQLFPKKTGRGEFCVKPTSFT